VKTLYPALADLNVVYSLVTDWTRRFFPLLQYKHLLTDETRELDDVHMEVPEREKRWGDWIQLRAYVAPATEMHPLTRYGVEHQRDVVLQVSAPDLVAAGLATQDQSTLEVTMVATIGDRFLHSDGVLYDVINIKRAQHFGNTDVPIWYEFTAERVRAEAPAYMEG